MLYPKTPNRSDSKLSYSMIKWLFDQVKKMIQLRFDPNYFFTQSDASGMYVTLRAQGGGGGADDPTQWAFGCSLTTSISGTAPDIITTYKVHIEEGDLLLQGKSFATVAAKDYELPSQLSSEDGDYCFPVVKMQLSDPTTATIEIASEYPEMSTSEILVPLIWLEFTKGEAPDKGNWHIYSKGNILHRGNIQMMSMLVSG